MTKLNVFCQTITIDSVTVSKVVFKDMIRYAIKYDSIKKMLVKKDLLIENLSKSSQDNFIRYSFEKNKRIESINKIQKILKKSNKKWGLGFSTGATFDKNFKIKPTFLLGINYSFYRF